MKFNFSKTVKFFIALGIQISILLIIILFKVSTLSGGTEIFLKLDPVDPRDPIRGDYMVLNYEISRIPKSNFLDKNIFNGETVYVPLYQPGKYKSVAYGVTKTKPNKQSYDTSENSKKNWLYIKGVVVSGGNNSSGFGEQPFGVADLGYVTVQYNIESYFIAEGKGATWPTNSSNAFAKVVVDDNGDAVLKRVFVNDKPWP